MTRSARHRGPITPRWVRGLLTGALLAVVSTSGTGCGLSYVFRNISPLHPTGWSFAWPILPSQQQRLEEDMAREERDRVPILDPIPGEFAPATCLDPPSEARSGTRSPSSATARPPFYETQRNNVAVPHREDRRQDRPVQGLSAGRTLPAGPLPLQVHHLLRRAVLVGLPDPVQPRRSPRRGRLHRQGPPPPLRRPGRRDDPSLKSTRLRRSRQHA